MSALREVAAVIVSAAAAAALGLLIYIAWRVRQIWLMGVEWRHEIEADDRQEFPASPYCEAADRETDDRETDDRETADGIRSEGSLDRRALCLPPEEGWL